MKSTCLGLAIAMAAAPAFADLRPCLIGTWQADTADMAHVMKTVMGAESASAISGSATMTIGPDSALEMNSQAVSFGIIMPGTPPMQVTVTGTTYGKIETSGVSFWVADTSGALSAEATVLGMVIPVDAYPATGGGASGIYGCTETGLSFEPDGALNSIPRKWTRIN